ncbi:MAG: hypothetical protein Q9190_002891 [Brigantiaea leucoxantha]
MKEDPPPDARCRDKFLVQTVTIAQDSDITNITAIWQNIEKVSKGSIQERKIRVVFLPADQRAPATPNHNKVNGTSEDAPPAYASPSPSLGSPIHNASTPMNQSTSTAAENQAQTGATAGTSEPTANPTSGTTASSSAPTSSEDLRAQLADANTLISKLRQQSEEQGLRQRKGDAVSEDVKRPFTTGTTGTSIQQQAADGVPVQMVAALCLLSFLLAYFFF